MKAINKNKKVSDLRFKSIVIGSYIYYTSATLMHVKAFQTVPTKSIFSPLQHMHKQAITNTFHENNSMYSTTRFYQILQMHPHEMKRNDNDDKNPVRMLNLVLSYPLPLPLWDPFRLESVSETGTSSASTYIPFSYLLLSLGVFFLFPFSSALAYNFLFGVFLFLGRILQFEEEVDYRDGGIDSLIEKYDSLFELSDLVAFVGALFTTDLLLPSTFTNARDDLSIIGSGGLLLIGLSILSPFLSMSMEYDEHQDDVNYISPSTQLLDTWDNKLNDFLRDRNVDER